MSKNKCQGIVHGTRRRGGPRMKWSYNIQDWTGLNHCASMRATNDIVKWITIVRKSSELLRLNDNKIANPPANSKSIHVSKVVVCRIIVIIILILY